jgi:hypothetical protein
MAGQISTATALLRTPQLNDELGNMTQNRAAYKRPVRRAAGKAGVLDPAEVLHVLCTAKDQNSCSFRGFFV